VATAGRRWRRGRYLGIAAVLVVVAAAVLLLLARRGRVVCWSEVLFAATKQRTVDGTGRLYAADGSQWQVAVWIRVDGPNAFTANSLLLPISGGGAQPSPEVMTLARAVNYLDAERGIVARLAREGATQPGRSTQFAGQPVREVVAAPSRGWSREAEAAGLTWRFYLDPRTKLVRGLDLLAGGKLAGKIEYHYNQPLPKGFRPGG